MPGLRLAKVATRWDGYRMTLDKKRRQVFDDLLYEMAGRREETLMNHPNNGEAVIMNILIEMEMRLDEIERKEKQKEEEKQDMMQRQKEDEKKEKRPG
jgi:hypothetical protein